MATILGAISLAICVNTDTSNSLALYATQGHKRSYQTSSYLIFTECLGMISASMFQRGHNLAIKRALDRSVPNTKAQPQFVCFYKDAITLHCNQSGVSILTKVYFFSLD